ncbi:methionine/alanine import family NSS transporter small subunit [Nocardioides ferulae]|nr:methionine/alanine import family NSS transporter small subunit [Nocardioides ferulae]
MSMEAVVMMVVAMMVIWGGLVGAIANLWRDDPSTFEDDAANGS